ncbi:SurA N-terminal domain-containing protein [Pelomonas sp. BJYL3]|uniref:SurA N-terminal domain-containing protein n=1 Tax=Pelomonas sp. BJYL3 TaxID=2976697 RepID=UPI0022B49E8F|nr:SurA N-terminal domain-containing protein [Pelomonas sp. BJYL3]
MFDFVRKHNRLFQLILLVLILPSFVALGVNGYSNFMDGSNAAVAQVDGQKITRAEWDAAHRQQSERLRQQMPNLDPKLLDSPEVRQRSLDNLVRERVLQSAVRLQHWQVSDEQLKHVFQTDPQFAALRQPDGSLNASLLASQGMNGPMFERRLRDSLAQDQVLRGVANSAVGSGTLSAQAFDAFFQRREVRLLTLSPAEFAAQVKPADAEIEAYFKDPANASKFQLPEVAQIEYVVLDAEALKAGVTVAEKDLKDYYEQNLNRYTVAEERRASHILIKADKAAPEAEKAKARARAEELLAQVQKAPASFADVARKNSQDEGSAVRGGDLDFFPRKNGMVEPFAAAAYALKVGEISKVVETEFGFHIIQLTAVRGGDTKSFDSVRAEIENEVRKQLAQKRYAELAETFSNTVYEQSDSLKPIAEKLGLSIRSALVQRKPAADAQGPLASAKLLDLVFSKDSLQNKRNTEAVEFGPSQLVAAHVTDYKPARMPAFDDVKAQVTQLLVARQAAAMAVKAGAEKLAALKASGDVGSLQAAQTVSRIQPGKLPPQVLKAILQADASKLPSFVGLEAGDGSYVIAAVTQVLPREGQAADPVRAAQQYAKAWSTAETEAYFKALKTQLKTTIKAPAAAASAVASN